MTARGMPRSPGAEELDGEGREAVGRHPVVTEKILSNLTPLAKTLPIVRHHYEAWDDSGYPDRRRGEEIPLGARVIALFALFDWLTSPRFPHKGLDTMAALEQIIQLSGRAFDGALVDQFAQFIEPTAGVSKECIRLGAHAFTWGSDASGGAICGEGSLTRPGHALSWHIPGRTDAGQGRRVHPILFSRGRQP